MGSYIWVHCWQGKRASEMVTLLLSNGLWPGPVWLTARLANRTSYSTQLTKNVVNVTTNKNWLLSTKKEHLKASIPQDLASICLCFSPPKKSKEGEPCLLLLTSLNEVTQKPKHCRPNLSTPIPTYVDTIQYRTEIWVKIDGRNTISIDDK